MDIAKMFDTIGAGITGFAKALGSAFTSVTSMFWDTTENNPTFLGALILTALSGGLVYFAFRMIRKLVRRVG